MQWLVKKPVYHIICGLVQIKGYRRTRPQRDDLSVLIFFFREFNVKAITNLFVRDEFGLSGRWGEK